MTVNEKANYVASWWHALQPNAPGEGDHRATLARLRRAVTLLEAAEEPATIQLARQLGGRPALEDAALCAAVLASVREDDKDSRRVARRIGAHGDEAPLISPLRFRRLIHTETREERLLQFRRLVALAKHKLNVTDLATALLDWSDQRRRDWIFWYYNADPPRPDAAAQQPISEGAAP